MSNHREAGWADAYLAYPCSTCKAEPGEACTTRAGRPAVYHLNRRRHGTRCPVCGVRVGREDEPGTLCARCSLVRSLEVERASIYRRVE